jgi:hypothetical protein
LLKAGTSRRKGQLACTASHQRVGPNGNGCPSPSCLDIRSAAPRRPCGRTLTPIQPATLERIDSASHYIRRITNIWAPALSSHPRDALTRDLLQILSDWQDSGDAAVLGEPARRIFSRGDSNLLNWLWDGASIRVVDYEFAGYSDLAFDCADLTEHISSREAGIDDQAWAEIVSLARLGGHDRRRFEAAQRTCALRWLAVLWKQRDTRTGEFTSQFDRVRRPQSAGTVI